MEEFTHLEGKIVNYILWDEAHKAEVVGCNRDIGITFVKVSDRNYILGCLLGPSSPQWKGGKIPDADLERHNIMFNRLIAAIESGTVDNDIGDDLYNVESTDIFGRGPTSSDCAYSQ